MRHAASTTRHPLCRSILRLLALALLLPLTAYAQENPPPAVAMQQILVADFNNDGIPDALVTSNAAPSAFLALGTTTLGTFSPATSISYFSDCAPGSSVTTVIGDFNGDTYPDIAFTCLNSALSNISVIAGVLLGNGDGTFAAAQTFPGAYGAVLLPGDFNHDGKLDLATVGFIDNTGSATGIMLFPGNGDGTFGPAKVSPFPAGLNYATASSTDINGDGFPDIVAGNFLGSGAYSVDVYGGNSDGTFGTSGNGNFTPNVSIPVGTYPTSLNTQILVGNFYDNGLNDIGVVDTGSGSAGVFLLQNTSTSGVFSLAPAVKTAIAGIQSAAAGRFTVAEDQGASDLLVSVGGALSVLHNTLGAGTGMFDNSYAGLALDTGSRAYSVADANLDGYQDVYLIDGTGALSVSLVSGSATATSMPVSPAASEPISAVWAGNLDFTGSTATGSIVVEGSVNATTTTLVSALNPAPLGSPVLLTATVAPAAISSSIPTGTVTFLDGTMTIGSSAINTAGIATFTTSVLASGAHTLTAAYSGDTNFAASTSSVLTETINIAPPDVVFSGPPSAPPGQQPTLTFTLVNPYPAPLSGTFTLAFTSSVTGRADDPSLQFAGGGRTLAFTIPALSTATPQVLLQSGTLSGTITITLALTTGGTNVTPPNLAPVVITVPASAPVVSNVTAAAPTSGNAFTVVIDGLSNTLEVASASFHFNAKPGATISDPNITVQVPTPFAQWFGSADSVQFGSLFSYTQQFLLSGGSDSINSVDVTLTNSAGTSTTVTGTVAGTTP